MEKTGSSQPLAGAGILVTRPREQADGLAALIDEAGGQALRFPALEIAEPADPHALEKTLRNLDDTDLAIFVSANAVARTMAALSRAGRAWPANLPAAAVGQATAQALRETGITNIIVPTNRFDSEGLLALPALSQASGQTLLLFRGEGGRTLLADTLRQRGAYVNEVACYRRARPIADPAPLVEWLSAGHVDIVTATSVETLENLCAIVPPSARTQLLALPLVVNSARVADTARALGFRQAPRISEQPSDKAILESVIAMRRAAVSR